MWKFRPIGKYYELLVDGDSIYLCRKQDTIIQAVLEDLCNRHNNEVDELLEEMNKESDFVVDCDEAYDNGYADGKEEAAQERYDAGYQLGKTEGYREGYSRGLADALGQDKIE